MTQIEPHQQNYLFRLYETATALHEKYCFSVAHLHHRENYSEKSASQQKLVSRRGKLW